jgi:hypothetical protein
VFETAYNTILGKNNQEFPQTLVLFLECLRIRRGKESNFSLPLSVFYTAASPLRFLCHKVFFISCPSLSSPALISCRGRAISVAPRPPLSEPTWILWWWQRRLSSYSRRAHSHVGGPDLHGSELGTGHMLTGRFSSSSR